MDIMVSTSIVIATRNRGAKIAATIKSILANTVQDFDLLIVDQSTNTDTYDTVKPFLSDSRVRYKLISIPGTSHARNIAFKETQGEIIIITDDDCILPPDWIEKITAPFFQHPKVGVVFCSVKPVPYNPKEGFTPNIIFKENRLVSTVKEALRGFGHGLGLGAGMAVRRETTNAIGGFDECLGPGSLFPSAEDKDVAIRALLKGWHVYEDADISVLHDGFRTNQQVRDLTKRDMIGAGGTFAKFIKCGVWDILPMIIAWSYALSSSPIYNFFHGGDLHGFKRVWFLFYGISQGMRMPVDRQSYTFKLVLDENTVTAPSTLR
jgi:glycosyltransferase involved in cell wall biosynthesis